LPTALNGLATEAQASDEDEIGASSSGSGSGRPSGSDSDSRICINNNDFNVVVEEEEEPPEPLTCEECFSKVLGPEKLASVNAILEGGFSFKIADQVLTINSLKQLCESFQGKTAENIFVALFPTSIMTVITTSDLFNIIFCLNDVLNLDSSVT
jgi:hypothetical protein